MGAAVALGMNSCNFFEPESPSAMDAKTVFANPMLTSQAIAGVYDRFGDDKSYRNRLSCGYIGLNTDAEYCNKANSVWADYSLTPAWSDISNAQGKDPWGYLSNAAERCNNIIEGINEHGDLNNPALCAYLGEAHFLRAFCYLEMIKIWGEAPARWVSLTKNPDGVHQGLVNRNEIYEMNRTDLKKAIEYLPWSGESTVADMKNNTGRASKGAAYALLMRNNMYYAGMSVHRADMPGVGGIVDFTPDYNVDELKQLELYAEVVEAMTELDAHESFKLLSDYATIFKNVCADVIDYKKSEVMWEIPFANGARGQFLQYNCPKSADALLGLKNNTSGSTNSIQMVVPTLYYEFAEGDVRRDITMVPFTWVFDDGGSYNSDRAKRKEAFPAEDFESSFLYQKMQMTGNWYLGKYRVEWMKRDRNGNDDGINYPVIRYADCLLLGAEAALYIGDANANEWFNRVHQRAGLPAAAVTLQAIKDERRFEFVGEYVRRWDLIRWGDLKETMERTKESIAAMDAHTGIFAGLPDTIYYKYRPIEASENLLYSEDLRGYVFDSIWGLKPGEVGPCPYYVADGEGGHHGWVKKTVYEDSKGRSLSESNYKLYDFAHPEYLNWHQYYPIFNNNIGSATNLTNSYNY